MEKKIVLTFDDGPCEDTLQILKILKRYNAKATFFVLGKKISGNESIIKKALKQGCEIGSHCYNHTYWAAIFRSKSNWLKEIQKTDKELSKIRIKTKFLRFPHLQHGIFGLLATKDSNKKVVKADLDSLDWWYYKEPDKVINRVLRKTKPNNIVAFHDYLENIGRNTNLPKILEKIIPAFKKQGYKFVNLSELAWK